MAFLGEANADNLTEQGKLDISDISSDISRIVDVTNSLGNTSRISFIYNEAYEAYRAQEGAASFWGEFIKGYNYDFLKYLQLGFVEKGLNPNLAERMAEGIASKYHSSSNYMAGSKYPVYEYPNEGLFKFLPSSSNKHWSPSAEGFDEAGGRVNIFEVPQVSAGCSVSGLSDSFNGEAWLSSFLGAQGNNFNFPEEYGKDFAAITKYHEIAHCMGADERLADYVAAKIYLKAHDTPDRAMEFLNLVRSLRAYNNLMKNEPKRYGDFFAIDSVIDEYKDGTLLNETEEEIWSQALLRSDFFKDAIGEVKNILFEHGNVKLQSALKERRFGDAGAIISDIGKTASPEYKFVFEAFSDAMRTLEVQVKPLRQTLDSREQFQNIPRH